MEVTELKFEVSTDLGTSIRAYHILLNSRPAVSKEIKVLPLNSNYEDVYTYQRRIW